MRNRQLNSARVDPAGRAEGESPLELSGFLFSTSMRPFGFLFAHLGVALEPMAQILGVEGWLHHMIGAVQGEAGHNGKDCALQPRHDS
jgi:hypothetical protein